MALDIFDINSANQEQQVTDRFLSRFRGGNRSAALVGLVSEAVSGMLDRPAPAAPRPSIPSPAAASAMGADRTMQFMQMQNQQAQAEAQRQLEAERIRMQEEASEKARQQQLKLEQLRMKNQIGMEKFRIESQQKLQELEIQRQQQAEERKKLEPFELEDGLIVQRGPDGSIMPVYQSPLYKQRQETSRAQQVAAQMRAASAGRGGSAGTGGNVNLQDWDVEEQVWNPETLAFDTIRKRMAFDPRAGYARPVTDTQGNPIQTRVAGTPQYTVVTLTDGSKRAYPIGPDGRPITTTTIPRGPGPEIVETGFQVSPATPRAQREPDFTPLEAAIIDERAYAQLPEEVRKLYTVDEAGVLVDKNDATKRAPADVLQNFYDLQQSVKAQIKPAPTDDGDEDVGDFVNIFRSER